MKPFAQKQNRTGSRWLALIGVAAAGFGLWHYDLVPELRPVPSGQLAVEFEVEVPELPDSWDQIVDRTVESELSGSGDFDSLLNAISDDAEPLEQVLTDLSEPDIAAAPPHNAEPTNRPLTQSAGPVRPASFDAPPTPPNISASSLNASSTEVVPVAASIESAPVLSAETDDVLRNVDSLVRQDRIVEAHNALSTLYWKEQELRPLMKRRLEAIAAEIFRDPHRHVLPPYLVEPGDTLESIGTKYDIPWQYLGQLNRISPRELQAGQELKVIRGPFSAVVDLSRFELTIDVHGYFVHRYKIGIGEGDSTPVGTFEVQEKVENPTWYNPDGGQVDKDDPQNPLGEYWIGLGDHIGIHGTIDPQSIGTARSRGCIHMRDDDITEVFGLLGTGSTVRIRP